MSSQASDKGPGPCIWHQQDPVSKMVVLFHSYSPQKNVPAVCWNLKLIASHHNRLCSKAEKDGKGMHHNHTHFFIIFHRATSLDTSSIFLSWSGKKNFRGSNDSSDSSPRLWTQQWKPFTQLCRTSLSSAMICSSLCWIFSATRWVTLAKSYTSGLFLTPIFPYNCRNSSSAWRKWPWKSAATSADSETLKKKHLLKQRTPMFVWKEFFLH